MNFKTMLIFFCCSISRERFEFLAECIKQLFPTEEKEHYYHFRKRSKTGSNYGGGSGLLYNRYRKLRQEADRVKLLTIPNKRNRRGI